MWYLNVLKALGKLVKASKEPTNNVVSLRSKQLESIEISIDITIWNVNAYSIKIPFHFKSKKKKFIPI